MSFKIKYPAFLLLLITGVLVSRCGQDKEECAVIPDTSGVSVELEFESLADSLVNLSSKEALVKLLNTNRSLRDYFFRRDQYPNDSVFLNQLYTRFNNRYIDTLLMET